VFTGIIEGLGTVLSVTSMGGGMRLGIQSDFPLEGTHVGDSIAVNGVCLTAVRAEPKDFEVDVAPETLSRSTMSRVKIRDRVNLERALRLGDRLDGHLVTGHIDGMGKVTAIQSAGNAWLFSFEISEGLRRYIVEKGSVAIDGISLTVNACNQKGFQISVIPHTGEVTTLGFKKVGDVVNIETDVIGKYVERFTRTAQGKQNGRPVDEALLVKTGFL
jgi:riboflavin synthase